MIPNRLTLAVLATASSWVPAQHTARHAQESPANVVFVLVDDLGWKDLGCQGSTFYETPNVDSLAARGVRFTNAYTASPVCSPTRASIMAGRHPARMKTTTWFGSRPKKRKPMAPPEHIHQLPLGETTLAEAFGEAGYRTAFLGKWHLGAEGFEPERQGFDVNFGGYRAGHPKSYFAPWRNPKLEDSPDGTYLTDRLGDEAAAFVKASADKPFFLYCAFYNVHTPLQAKPDLVEHYQQKKAALPKPAIPRFAPEPPRKVRQVQDHAKYAAMVHSMDENVGKVLDALRETGVEDNTIIVFMSDNGGLSTSEGSPTSNLPLRGGKGWLYEGGIRVPMITVWPEHGRKGAVSDQVVLSTDFYPTLLEMADLPPRPKQHLDGRSYAKAVRGGVKNEERPVFVHFPHYSNQGGAPGSSLRLGRWKIIESFETNAFQLFDLELDLSEQTDCSQTHPEVLERMRDELKAWKRRTNAGAMTRRN